MENSINESKEYIEYKKFFESLYNQLKEKLSDQKKIDSIYIQKEYRSKQDQKLFEKQIKDLEKEYELYATKLEFIPKINKLNVEEKKKSISIMGEINYTDDFSIKEKIATILSYGVLLNYFKGISERSYEEISVLACSTSELNVEDYVNYVEILNDNNVLKAVFSRTDNFRERIEIAHRIIRSQSKCSYNYITGDNHLKLVNNGLNVVRNYISQQRVR